MNRYMTRERKSTLTVSIFHTNELLSAHKPWDIADTPKFILPKYQVALHIQINITVNLQVAFLSFISIQFHLIYKHIHGLSAIGAIMDTYKEWSFDFWFK